LTTLELKLAELEMKSIDNKQYVIQQDSRVDDLNIQLGEIKLKATHGALEISQARAARKSGLMELQDRIETMERELAERANIPSPDAGRILELSVQPGQVTSWGARIGAMEVEDGAGTEQLKTLAYFPLRTGKRLEVGMKVRVTPATVERERHGSILGEVTRVSTFPVSAEAAAARIGSSEIVQTLMQPGGMIEVEIKLERADTYSGFRWTASGPPKELKFGAGITAGVRVTMHEYAPITYLFPILRESMGGQ
jgi:HlyD family secretion protein